MSVTLLRQPPDHREPPIVDPPRVDPEALVEEARRRARRRRQRNFVGILAAILGALSLDSLLGGGGPRSGTAVLSKSSSPGAARLKASLPEQLSYNANGGIVLLRRDGARRILARGIDRHQPNGKWLLRLYSGIEWSPDGSKLLVSRWGSRRALVVMDAHGKMGPTIAPLALDARWSPDGTRIAFVRHEPGAGPGRVLYVVSSDGRSVTRVAEHVQIFGGFSWSPDGTELAYAGQGTSGLFIADASGRGTPRPVPIAAGAGAPATEVGEVQWSPDGSLIAFTTGDGVSVIRPDGTSLRLIADGGWYGIVWSPDSRLLAMAGPAGPAFGDVSVVRADGGGLHRIARCPCTYRGASGQYLAWSPDGSRIAYISGQGNSVSTIRPDGPGATVVAPRAVPGPSGLQVGSPLWRPAP